MADDPSIAYKTTPGTGETALTVAADDVGGKLFQRVKPTVGADGTAVDVSPTNPMPTRQRAGTATLSNVSGSASSVTLKAANTARFGLTIFNDSTAVLSVKFGATASATSFTVQIAAGGYYEMPSPIYTGVVDGIWASATGAARVTELTD